MFNRILQCFVNLRSLRLIQVELSLLSEQRNPVLFGSFGRGITKLLINKPVCTYSTFISLILSLPNLQTLVTVIPEPKGVLPPTLPNVPKRVLKNLLMYRGGTEVGIALSQCPLSFRAIAIVRPPPSEPPSIGLHALLVASSGIVEKVELSGKSPLPLISQKLRRVLVDLAYAPDEENYASHPCTELPPLVALCELRVGLGYLQIPPRWLVHLLTAITSAPGLSSIYFKLDLPSTMGQEEILGFASDDRWILIDRWLASLVEGHGQCPVLTVILLIPNARELLGLGTFLSECRGAGVEVVINPC